MFVLTKEDLDRSLAYYPEIAEQIREVAGNRANLVKKRSQIAAKAAAEGKSAADAAKAAAQVQYMILTQDLGGRACKQCAVHWIVTVPTMLHTTYTTFTSPVLVRKSPYIKIPMK